MDMASFGPCCLVCFLLLRFGEGNGLPPVAAAWPLPVWWCAPFPFVAPPLNAPRPKPPWWIS